ncbi:MAG: cell division protein FtsL, partial [Candidatus Eremiobacterota bacterium]
RKRKEVKVRPLKRRETSFPLGLTLVLSGILVVLVIMVIQQSTHMMSKQYYLCELNETRQNLEEQNLKLVNQFNTLSSLDRIENIANTKLGMSRPDFEGRVILFQQSKNLALIK